MPALSQRRFDALMTPFIPHLGKHIAVGVSGGADSLCLTLLLAHWAQKHGVAITAFTVDHRLRPVSGREAAAVHDFLTKQGIAHRILPNETAAPQTGIEEYARNVRYELLLNACRKDGVSALFLAHHLTDQAETFFMRLGKSSGLTGLCGMRAMSRRAGVLICRPLLTVDPAEMKALLREKDIPWVQDEMNDDLHYARVRWRKLLPLLEVNGVRAGDIGETMRRLTSADEALTEYADAFIRQAVWIDFRGFARVPVAAWQACPQAVRERVIAALIAIIGQGKAPVSLKSLEALCARLPTFATMAGCVFVPHKTGLFIAREYRKAPPAITLKKGDVRRWDRFLLTAYANCVVGIGKPVKGVSTLPAAVQKTFPAVFIQKELEKNIQIDYKEKNDPIIRIELMTETEAGEYEKGK